ncbi:TMEM43 family protein [Patescibacteria group bacterium]
MPDQFTEVVRTGWGSRIIKSIKGIVVGFVLFVVSLGLLYWNDGRVDISEIAQDAIPLAATEVTDDPAMQHQMVSVTGEMAIVEPVGDEGYLAPGDYVALMRQVEMYAWIEDRETESETEVGGAETTTTTYTYRKDWTDSPEDSGFFEHEAGHENPELPIEGRTISNTAVSVGAYEVDMSGIRLRGWEPVNVDPIGLERGEDEDGALPVDTDGDGLLDEDEVRLGTDPTSADTDGDGLDDGLEVEVHETNPLVADTDGDTYDDLSEVERGFDPNGEGETDSNWRTEITRRAMALKSRRDELAEATERAEAVEAASAEMTRTVEGGKLFLGQGTPASPEIGDVRVSFEAIRAGQTGTVFGELSGTSITPYLDEDNNRVHSLSVGSRETALADMHSEYVFSLWMLRFLGFILMWFGLSLVLGPISVLLDVLPFLGRVSRAAVGLLTFVVSLVLTTLTIVVSRLLHSPIAILISLAVAAVLVVVLVKRFKKEPEAAPTTPLQPPPQQ